MADIFTVTAVSLRCNACAATATLTGPACRDQVGDWMAAHWLPVVAEVDVTDEYGHTYTMRRSHP